MLTALVVVLSVSQSYRLNLSFIFPLSFWTTLALCFGSVEPELFLTDVQIEGSVVVFSAEANEHILVFANKKRKKKKKKEKNLKEPGLH